MNEDKEIAKKAKHEELKAIGQYDMHLAKAQHPKLRAILEYNKMDELEHAYKLKAWLLAQEAKEHSKVLA